MFAPQLLPYSNLVLRSPSLRFKIYGCVYGYIHHASGPDSGEILFFTDFPQETRGRQQKCSNFLRNSLIFCFYYINSPFPWPNGVVTASAKRGCRRLQFSSTSGLQSGEFDLQFLSRPLTLGVCNGLTTLPRRGAEPCSSAWVRIGIVSADNPFSFRHLMSPIHREHREHRELSESSE